MLPNRQESAGAAGDAPAAGAAVASRRILIVDDNQDVAESLSAWLSDWGHDVRVSHDGEAALREVLIEGGRTLGRNASASSSVTGAIAPRHARPAAASTANVRARFHPESADTARAGAAGRALRTTPIAATALSTASTGVA